MDNIHLRMLRLLGENRSIDSLHTSGVSYTQIGKALRSLEEHGFISLSGDRVAVTQKGNGAISSLSNGGRRWIEPLEVARVPRVAPFAVYFPKYVDSFFEM
ncbi:MAG: hypothetical protein KDD62_16040 [Bdellovibrionales bacterium]|nr:hypothetical protein [Bdellovibrionales bacterium]